MYITEYVFISTFSFSAISFAIASGLTLNPIIIAFDTFASVTSLSVIAPTFACITLTFTSSFDNFSNDCFTASTDPWTSAFTIIFNCFRFPFSIWLNKSSNVTLDDAFNALSLAWRFLLSIKCFAVFSSFTS